MNIPTLAVQRAGELVKESSQVIFGTFHLIIISIIVVSDRYLTMERFFSFFIEKTPNPNSESSLR